MVVAGKVELEQVKALSEKWFGPIPSKVIERRNLPKEPKQVQKRTFSVQAKVPANALYKAWHMVGRTHADYYAADLSSDVLSRGQSSRFYQKLIKEKEIFTSISSYVTGTIDPGLFVVSGRLKPGISMEQAEREVDMLLQEFTTHGPTVDELEKVKNQSESTMAFGNAEVINRAMNLAYSAWLGDANLVNTELEKIRSVTHEDILRVASAMLTEENASVLYYHAAEN